MQSYMTESFIYHISHFLPMDSHPLSFPQIFSWGNIWLFKGLHLLVFNGLSISKMPAEHDSVIAVRVSQNIQSVVWIAKQWTETQYKVQWGRRDLQNQTISLKSKVFLLSVSISCHLSLFSLNKNFTVLITTIFFSTGSYCCCEFIDEHTPLYPHCLNGLDIRL